MNKLDFKAANTQKRIWLDVVAKECRLKGNESIVLEAIAYATNPETGIGEPCIGTIMEEAAKIKRSPISYDAVRQNIKRLVAKGALRNTHRGNQQSNRFELIGYEFKLENLSRESSNNPNIYITNNKEITYYSEYESFLAKSEIQLATPCRPLKAESKKASLDALNSDKADDEVRRVCKAWGVAKESDIEYAVKRMRNRDMRCPASFLVSMAKGLKCSVWNISDLPDVGNSADKPAMRLEEKQRIIQELEAKAKVLAAENMESLGYKRPDWENDSAGYIEFDNLLIVRTRTFTKKLLDERFGKQQ